MSLKHIQAPIDARQRPLPIYERGMAAAVGTTRHLIFWHHQVMVTSSGTSGPAFDILAPTVATSYGTSGPTYHHPTPSTGRIVEGRPAKEARGDPKEGIMVSLPAFDETGNQGSWRMAKQGHLRCSLLAITCVESSGRGNKEQEATKGGEGSQGAHHVEMQTCFASMPSERNRHIQTPSSMFIARLGESSKTRADGARQL